MELKLGKTYLELELGTNYLESELGTNYLELESTCTQDGTAVLKGLRAVSCEIRAEHYMNSSFRKIVD